MFKKTISLILILALVSICCAVLSACESQPTSYTLTLVSSADSGVHEVRYPYTINWDNNVFLTHPAVFSQTIARTSMILSASAYDSELVMQNLEALNFSQKAKFNYQSDYKDELVGVAIASKIIDDTPVVMVVLRGTYEQEWYSNFDIGADIKSTLTHNGFNNASQFVLDKINMYIQNYSIDKENARFVVTGHSRGGAIANLVAKSLIDRYSSDKIYAYTFATPNTTTSPDATAQKYSSIFNFINPQDFICHIPLNKWGFTKYGTTITFDTGSADNNSDIINTVSNYYQKYTNSPLKSFDGTKSIAGFIDSAYKLAPTVDDYYNKKYEISGLSLSLYDYMMTVSYLINNENVLANGLIMLGSDSSVFEPITTFLLSGMNSDNALSELDFDNSLIAYAHMPQTYLAWLDTYIQNM